MCSFKQIHPNEWVFSKLKNTKFHFDSRCQIGTFLLKNGMWFEASRKCVNYNINIYSRVILVSGLDFAILLPNPYGCILLKLLYVAWWILPENVGSFFVSMVLEVGGLSDSLIAISWSPCLFVLAPDGATSLENTKSTTVSYFPIRYPF